MLFLLNILPLSAIFHNCTDIKAAYTTSKCCEQDVTRLDVVETMILESSHYLRMTDDMFSYEDREVKTKAVCGNSYEEFVIHQRTSFLDTCIPTARSMVEIFGANGYPLEHFGYSSLEVTAHAACMRQLAECARKGAQYGVSMANDFNTTLRVAGIDVDKLACSTSMAIFDLSTEAERLIAAIQPNEQSTLLNQYEIVCEGKPGLLDIECVTRRGVKVCMGL
jgi:hypothetical protein